MSHRFDPRLLLLSSLLALGLLATPPLHAQGRPDIVWMASGAGGRPAFHCPTGRPSPR